MKIYLPDQELYLGGPKTFLINLRKYLSKDNELTIVDEDIKSDTILFPVEYPKDRLDILKRKKINIIQRLDGVFYPPNHTEQQIAFNETIKNIYLYYADYIIFQSSYSKAQCFEVLGKKNEDDYRIIINGVDKDIFKLSTKSFDKNNIKFITTGNFRSLDMIAPLISALDSLHGYNFELTIIGRVSNPDIQPLLDRKYIKYFQEVDLENLSNFLRESDIFLYSFINPVCPNSVLEAISTGMPVVGLDSGAMPELLHFNKDLLAYVSSDLFQNEKDIKPELIAEKISLLLENFDKYKHSAMSNSHLYSMKNCADEYADVIKSVRKSNVYNKIINLFRK